MLIKRVLWLVGLSLLPAFGIQTYNEVALRASREEVVRIDVMRTATDVAQSLADIAETVREGLSFVSKEDVVREKDPVG